jgi:hypothetical protein
VLSIWEGTTNVLSLDVLRATAGGDALGALGAAVARRLARVSNPALVACVPRVEEALRRIEAYTARAAEDAAYREAGARSLAFALARTYTAALLLDHAEWSLGHEGDRRAVTAAVRWCAQDLAPLGAPDAEHRSASALLVWPASGELHAGADLLRRANARREPA